MQNLIVSTFPNAKALPLWAAQTFGLFARRNLDVTLHETGSSAEQRKLLASGGIHIVQAAVDNALAMIEAGLNVKIIMGGESGMNDFVVQPAIRSLPDLAGGRLLVDSPHTAYALLAGDLLARHGLAAEKDYQITPVGNGSKRLNALLADVENTAAILNPPFTALAKIQGLHSLGRLDDLFGPYQAGGAFVMHDWAAAHCSIIEQYIETYLEALEWMGDRNNDAAAIVLLAKRLNLSAEIARTTFEQLRDPVGGFTPMAQLDKDGFANTIALRTGIGDDGKQLDITNNCLDLSYYRRVIARKLHLAQTIPAPVFEIE